MRHKTRELAKEQVKLLRGKIAEDQSDGPEAYEPCMIFNNLVEDIENKDLLETRTQAMLTHGHVTTENGFIGVVGDSMPAAFIPAISVWDRTFVCFEPDSSSVDKDDKKPITVVDSMITRTLNNGYRFAGIDPETMNTVDLGPVIVPCITDGGIFIPVNNNCIGALYQGREILDRLIEKHMDAIENRMNDSKDVDSIMLDRNKWMK